MRGEKKIKCLECEWANIYNNKCDISNKKLYCKGEQITKKCDLFKKSSGNFNEQEERDVKQ